MSNLILLSLLISGTGAVPLIRPPHHHRPHFLYAGGTFPAFPAFYPILLRFSLFFCRFYFVSLAPFLTLCRLLFMRSVITIRANEWHIRLPLKQISISAIERWDYGEEFNL